MKKVLVTEPIHAEGLALLRNEVEVVMCENTSIEQIIEQAKGCHGILIRSAKIPKEVIESTPTLQVVGKHGIGVDNIDVDYATEKGVMVVNAPESNVNAVAEHAMAMICEVSKNLKALDKEVRNDNFKARSLVVNMELKNKTAGLVGLGKISSLLAGKLVALGLKVVAYDPYVSAEKAAEMGVELIVELDDLLAVSDFVSLHVPLNKHTEGLIGKVEFEKMKDSAYLINVARGPVVDEAALYHALKNKVIKGAATDVYEIEPPKADNNLFELENVLLSPHNAALTDEALVAMATHSAQGILDCLNDKLPKYVVNKDVLK